MTQGFIVLHTDVTYRQYTQNTGVALAATRC